MSVAWDRVAATTRGVTWDRLRRRSTQVRALLAAGVVAGTAGGVALQAVSASIVTPLPDLTSVEQVVGAPGAWLYGATGKGVDVALLDTGVTPVQGLSGSDKLVYGPDLSFDSQDPSTAYVDGFGHGTAMASIIAGNDGTVSGYHGVAPKARIVSVKVGASNGAVDVSQIIAGIDWVAQHAHDPGYNIRVLNLSLGTNSTQSYLIDPLAQAAENAWRHGVVVVASVGNDGSATTNIADPAVDPYVLAVGAEDPMGTVSTDDDVIPSYSSKGNWRRHADVVAPGSYIMSLLAPNSYLSQQYPNAVFNGRFFRGSGTSQAAAVTSGAVADLLSAHPDWTPDMVKNALMDTAVDISNTSRAYAGAGIINVRRALWDNPWRWDVQRWTPSDGSGSLEAARGSQHVSFGSDTLSGEQDIFGNAWDPSVMVPAEKSLTAWNGGVYNSATWSGSSWASATWSSATWSGSSWASATWSSATWSSATWSSATWSSATWSSATWSSATWSSATWSSATWSSATWSSATWSGADWA